MGEEKVYGGDWVSLSVANSMIVMFVWYGTVCGYVEGNLEARAGLILILH